MGRLSSSVVLVTDVSGEVGRACREACAEEGATVVCGPFADPAAAVDSVVGGHGRLDALVTVPGDEGAPDAADGGLDGLEDDAWQRAQQRRLWQPMRYARRAVAHMAAAGGGSIVHLTSSRAASGVAASTARASAEAALTQLSLSTATQFGKAGVRSNVVRVGPLAWATRPDDALSGGLQVAEHTVLRRLGRPEEVAAVAVFLASDEASYITGQVIGVDGGLLSRLPHVAFAIANDIATTKR